MARPVERRAARDFVLDAHGLTALAAPSALANEWLEYIFEERPGSEVWVPDLVIVESTTGTPADANVNRFLKTLGSTKEAERHWLSADERSYRRALSAGYRSVAGEASRFVGEGCESSPRPGARGAGPGYPRGMGPEGRSTADAPSPPSDFGVMGRLDDEHLIASLRAMSMGERLESGFELCEFASELAGSARQ